MSVNSVSRLILIVILVAFSLVAVAQNSALPNGGADAAKPEATTTEAIVSKTPAISSEYRVGEGDTLQIGVWKEPDLSKTVVVRPDGLVSLPLIGELKVSGMRSAEIQDVVASKLKAYLLNPRVTVEINEIKSRRVFITGEIVRPGLYPLGGPTTVLQLIAEAGGFTPFAKRKSIVILRQESGHRMKHSFNYPDVVHGRTPEQNIVLAPGDTVVVP
jgi:polysaccharide export outer membrane protein